MSSGPLHLFFADLCANAENITVEIDNAKGHAERQPKPEVPMTTMRRASSTGSLGINKIRGRGGCRWSTGCLSSKAEVEPRSDESMEWVDSDYTSPPEMMRVESYSSLDESSSPSMDESSCRWSSPSSLKKDGAAKLPLRRRTAPEEEKNAHEDESSFNGLFICLEEAEMGRLPVLAPKRVDHHAIPPELFCIQ